MKPDYPVTLDDLFTYIGQCSDDLESVCPDNKLLAVRTKAAARRIADLTARLDEEHRIRLEEADQHSALQAHLTARLERAEQDTRRLADALRSASELAYMASHNEGLASDFCEEGTPQRKAMLKKAREAWKAFDAVIDAALAKGERG